MRNLVMVEL